MAIPPRKPYNAPWQAVARGRVIHVTSGSVVAECLYDEDAELIASLRNAASEDRVDEAAALAKLQTAHGELAIRAAALDEAKSSAEREVKKLRRAHEELMAKFEEVTREKAELEERLTTPRKKA